MITTTTSAAVKASYDIVPLPASISMQKGEPFMLSSATQSSSLIIWLRPPA